ncbi:hypothetical protein CRG98_029145 [Punica granatum]|uniref:Uncharacterized protein n=1 Tax=Punica granatum TaxID=22663 RepID=A0A2I0J2K1_PUNGR|nr:hypothetical protein CRG98_029145 [Punica granatum]
MDVLVYADVTGGECLPRSLPPDRVSLLPSGCLLEWHSFEAEGHACPRGNACLSIKTVALTVYGSLSRFCLQLRKGYLRVEPLPCRSIRKEVREEFSEGRDPVHLSSPMTGVSL